MWLFIESLDVLLFRDSKPFAAGEGFWARSVFPPNSLPFMGALRAKLLVDNDIRFEDYHKFLKDAKNDQITSALKRKIQPIADLIGGSEGYGNLTLAGPFLSRQSSTNELILFFPAPLDIMLDKNRVKYLKPQSFGWGLKTSKALTSKIQYKFSPLPLWTDESGDLPEEKFIKTSGIINYLKGLSGVQAEDSTNIWGNEFQVGIEKGAQRTAEIGKIYSVEFIRLQEIMNRQGLSSFGFLVQLEGFQEAIFKTDGLLALGGEGRAAKYTKVEETEIGSLSDLIRGDFLIESLKDEKRFKLYLATPAIFSNGWYPDFLKAENGDLVGEIGGLKFKLISASVNKPTTVSGWNLVKNRPRPLVKAVPAGSIYHFELLDDEVFDEAKIEVIRSDFHFKPLTGNCPNALGSIPENDLREYGRAGFGLALVGKI